MRAPVHSAVSLVALFLSTLAFGQSSVTVELDDIADNRVSAGGFVGSALKANGVDIAFISPAQRDAEKKRLGDIKRRKVRMRA